MILNEFKNGNINLKFTKETLKKILDPDTNETTFFNVCSYLDINDCYSIGDVEYIGSMAVTTFYSVRLGVAYKFSGVDVDDLEKGKTIKLYAEKLTAEEITTYERML